MASSSYSSTYESGSGSTGDWSGDTSNPPAASSIAAIVAGRGSSRGEIGFAHFDLEPVHLSISQFTDTAAYNKLRIKMQIYRPTVVLMPESACRSGGDMVMLRELLKEEFQGVTVLLVVRSLFNRDEGMDKVTSLCMSECSYIDKDLSDKYYGLACAAAVVRYVEGYQNVVLIPRSIKITCKGMENTCVIDPSTAKHLELLMAINKHGIDPKGPSLYKMLNHTTTKGAARLLRANILQPLTDVQVIQPRLDAIADLLSNDEMFNSLKQLVGRMKDVDKIISLCTGVPRVETAKTSEYKITQILVLKHMVELAGPMREILSNFNSTLLKSCHQKLSDPKFEEMLTLMQQVIHDDAHLEKGILKMRLAKCFCVIAGINGKLDAYRQMYNEISEDMDVIHHKLVEDYNMPFSISYSTVRGFYLTLKASDMKLPTRMPPEFINITCSNTQMCCSTSLVLKVNDRINYIMSEIFLLCSSIVTQLIADLNPFLVSLYALAETVAEVDMIVSLAEAASEGHYVMPVFHGITAVIDGRHPMLDQMIDIPVVPNDTVIGADVNFIIVTGPNMGGKSTYLKQVAVLQIMAQMGSFVPATTASFTICTQIFSRMGQPDDSECGSFVQEMKDIGYIMDQMTGSSLVIIDELAKATCPEEGFALAVAICEWFIAQESRPQVLFATHFLELSALDCSYPNVENFHFNSQVVVTGGRQKYVPNHQLQNGPYRGPTYGFEIVEMSRLPKCLVDQAKEMSAAMVAAREESFTRQPEFLLERAVFRCGRRICSIIKSFQETPDEQKMGEEELRQCFKAVRDQFRGEKEEIDKEFGPVDPSTGEEDVNPPPSAGSHPEP